MVWAVDRSGKVPGLEFFESLSTQERAKIQARFELLAEQGRISDEKKFKKLEKRRNINLFEFKRHQLRFIGAFSPRNQSEQAEFVIACGVTKKADKHVDPDIERAARILKEHFDRRERERKHDG